MSRALKRPRFLLDLAEELTWLNEHAGPEVAERWYQSLKETIQFLEQHPLIGRPRKDLTPAGIRSWRVKNFPRWLLFYTVRDGQVVLLRVRSGTMNLVVLAMNPKGRPNA
jgi:plasmid stabilization system protein ParE